jgi:hypothetical protein
VVGKKEACMYRLFWAVEFEVLTAVVMKVGMFWDIAACSPYVNQRLGRMFLPNAVSYTDYTPLYPRRCQLYFSLFLLLLALKGV